MNVLANVRRGRYLAFVDSRVSDLWVLDLERPVLAGRLVNRPEPLVTGVGVSAHSQQMDVPMSDPRHLKYTLKRFYHYDNSETRCSGSWWLPATGEKIETRPFQIDI